MAGPYACLGKRPCPCMHFWMSSELLKSVSQSPLLVLWFTLWCYHELDETKAQNVLQLFMAFSLWLYLAFSGYIWFEASFIEMSIV